MAGDISQNIQKTLQNNDNLLPMQDMIEHFDILNAVLLDVQSSYLWLKYFGIVDFIGIDAFYYSK